MIHLRRELIGHESADDQFASAYAQYNLALAKMSLPRIWQELAQQNFHDGIFVRLCDNHEKDVHIEIMCGDLPTGYKSVVCIFRDYEIIDNQSVGWKTAAYDRRTDIIATEVTQATAERGRFCILFYPRGELCIEAAGVSLAVTPLDERKLTYFGDPIIL